MPYKNKEDKNQNSRKWRRENRDKVNDCNRRRREKVHKIGGKPYPNYRTPEENRLKNEKQRQERKDYLLESLGSCCIKCGSTESLEFDHINPALKKSRQSFLSMGLSTLETEIDNIQVLCHTCHKTKSTAQKKAAWKLFTSLSLDQQEELLNE